MFPKLWNVTGLSPPQKKSYNGYNIALYLKTEKQWHSNVKACAKRVPIRKGTGFESSTISFFTAFRFIYSWRRELMTTEWGKEEFELSEKTVMY
ncbi:hypothetical protein X975_24116, partial [Stegodyphus mimosarum]